MRKIVFVLSLISILSFSSQALATTVSVVNTSGCPGQQNIPVNINLSDTAPGITGIDLTLKYDAKLLQVTGVKAGDLASTWNIASNSKVPGTINITIFGVKPLQTRAGSIAVLNFRVKNNAAVGLIVPMHLSIAKFNEKSADSLIAGVFTITKKVPGKKK